MQTVQEAFRKAKKDDLVEQYLVTYPIQINDFDDETTIGEAKATARKTIAEYVDRLRNLATKPSHDGQTWLFYAYHYPKDWITEPDFSLVPLNELRQKGIDTPSYGFEFTEQAEVMGYYIADSQLTKHYLEDLLVYIMYEASFFGLKQEHLQDELDNLEQATKEIDDGEGQTMTMEDFEREIGLEDLDRFTSQEEKYLHKMEEYERKIVVNSKSTEINEILQSQPHD